MACVAVNSLMRTIELEFLQPHLHPGIGIEELVSRKTVLFQSLHQKLGSLMELFDESRMDGVEAIEDLETRLRDVAFRVEDEIELLVLRIYASIQESWFHKPASCFHKLTSCFHKLAFWFHKPAPQVRKPAPQVRKPASWVHKTASWFHNRVLHSVLQRAIKDIEDIEQELGKVKKYTHIMFSTGNFPRSDEAITIGNCPKSVSQCEGKMVGKDNEFKTIMQMLIQHPSKQREVVSIKGMAGIGKTMLARRVYGDKLVVSHFDKQAWVVASQHHNKRQMLVSLLKSIYNHNNADDNSDDGELALRFYQSLKGARYLVVIDDLWSGEAWDAIKPCFPDDGCSSRVLLTTRIEEVANYTRSNNDFSLKMQLLDQNESWNLFCEKALRFCDVEFEMIGRHIVEKCRGLPLAIVVVAGLFSKLNTLEERKNMSKALRSHANTTIDEECSHIFSLSYNHLPHNLKACFLYLGVFREDEEINATDLARLWAAEGLVKKLENESCDEVARRYIQELKDRNLIIASKQSCSGKKIRELRMHDLLHAFCVRKAQKECLLHVVRENGSNSPRERFRWFSIQSEDFDISTLGTSLNSFIRSIIYCENMKSIERELFNWLRVIRVLYCPRYSGYDNIGEHVFLRYLTHPQHKNTRLKVFKAWNLQTLHVSRDYEMNYFQLPQLQYFNCYAIDLDPPEYVHQNLQSISWLKPYHCTEEFLSKIPYVRKVKISGERRDSNVCIWNLAYLHQLERLYIHAYEYESRRTSPCMIPINKSIVLLQHLTKLSLGNMGFAWKEINVLCELPRLEVLRLFGQVCVGEEWELTEDDKFRELIYLEVGSTDLKHWEASGDNFPKLERLLLSSCTKLKEIPSDFAGILTLNSIELKQCLSSAVTSAKQIQEEQQNYGNDNMVVIVQDMLDDSSEDEFDELQ